MTGLPYMPMYWGDFFADTELAMSGEARAYYAILLGRMWVNHGWLPADDQRIARAIGVDVRSWRHRLKAEIVPLLRREIDPIIGPIYRQRRLAEELDKAADLTAKNRARTAAAREAKSRKSKSNGSVTEHHLASVTEPVTGTATGSVTDGNARARLPEPEEPSPLRSDGSGSPLTPTSELEPPGLAVARSPAAGGPLPRSGSPGSEVPLGGRSVDELAGPFVPSRPAEREGGLKPIGDTAFLRQLAAFKAGDEHALDPPHRPPPLRPIAERANDDVWARVNQRMQPHRPPPGSSMPSPAKEPDHGRRSSDDDLIPF